MSKFGTYEVWSSCRECRFGAEKKNELLLCNHALLQFLLKGEEVKNALEIEL